ncbi:MAG TPA: lipopolysaccharide kinase InaA family protein [Thermodesulfobacteriota bacterium]|nr:lipopolysaccharide kinase InaA family protein [Thermodesulfobacteriota bacterium]
MKFFPLLNDFVFRSHMVINRKFESLLQENGLDNFDAMMKFDKGDVVKQKSKHRSTLHFYLTDKERRVSVYLKRYRFSLISTFVKNCLFFFRTYSAIHEGRNILAFIASDLPTMTLIAVGMRQRIPLWNESFLLTQGIPHTKTLEQELEDCFYPPLDRIRIQQKRLLIAKLAGLTKRMHGKGFMHQDFYLCHILINSSSPDDPILYVADLHRVRRKKTNKKTWRIKDLAALNYSAPQKLISRTDRLRFMKHYDPILANNRLFLKKIIKKTGQIRSHEEKKG